MRNSEKKYTPSLGLVKKVVEELKEDSSQRTYSSHRVSKKEKNASRKHVLKPPKAPKPKVMGVNSSPMNKQIKKETL